MSAAALRSGCHGTRKTKRNHSGRVVSATALVGRKGERVGAPAARRLLQLAAGKLTATEALEKGIVDSEHVSAEATVEAAVGLAEKLVAKKWDGEVYAEIRMELFSEVLGEIRANSTGSWL
ncbi:hypothetical protein L484_026345 [Morus notabilis]|uniref:Uncharacterized protein n=1 Tax=Morus notabilis TaxID=981085 RepID=W9QXV1_9ROSA|nr:hypothetical protein L484_026345 [Morus notabilis]